MKTKRFIIYTFILAFSAMASFVFYSCLKDDILDNIETNSDILCFKDFNEYKETLDIIFTFNIEERKYWEESKGFKSFGRVCDEIYDSKSPEDFVSIDEIKEFVSKNDSYLRLIEDENGELTLETVLSNNQDRYFINKEKMFKINNTVYKVFENITVLTKEENINNLKKIDEKNLLSLTNNPDFIFINATMNQYVKAGSFDCGTNIEETQINGNNRTRMWLECLQNKYTTSVGFQMSEFAYRWTIRPYKKTAGIWLRCSRNVDYNIKVVLEYYKNNWNLARVERSGHFEGSFGQKVEWIRTEPGWEDWYQLHFAGYKAWADTPSTDPAYTTCNLFFFLPEGPPIK